MPNRRRRKLSTAMSAVAALAVVSPIAITAITDLTKPAPQPREFRQAAMITDLPNELMSALSQGLSQFGINLPPMPTSMLTGSDAGMPTTLTAPGGLGAAPLTAPGGLGTAPCRTWPAPLPTPGLGTAPLTATGLGTDPATAVPALGSDALANPALTGTLPAANPALTSPTGATPGGLTTPPVTGADPALATTPIANGVGLPAPGEVPIAAPIGLDGLGSPAGTYPIIGGDSLGASSLAAAPSTGSGGLLGDLSSAFQTLGGDQAIDLLKGVVMPMITSAMKPGAIPAARHPYHRCQTSRRPHSPAPKRHRRSQVAGSAVPLQDIGQHFCRVETLVTTDTYVTSVRAVPSSPDAVHRDRGHRGDTAVGAAGHAVR